MSYSGAGYTGWHRWLYPRRIAGATLTVKEDAGGDFDNPDRQDTVSVADGKYYATDDDHASVGLPYTGLYDHLETLLNGAALQNDYRFVPFTPSQHAMSGGSVELERTAGTDAFELTISGLDPGWLGWQESTSAKDDGGDGVIEGTVSYFGACHLPADQAADARGWPQREAGVSRRDTVNGQVREVGRHTRRTLRYRQLGAVDIWPSRVVPGSLNPLYDAAAFDDSAFFSAALQDRNAQWWNLYRWGGTLEDILVVWGDGDGNLSVTSNAKWERGKLLVEDDPWAHLDDTEPDEQYDVAFGLAVIESSWSH